MNIMITNDANQESKKLLLSDNIEVHLCTQHPHLKRNSEDDEQCLISDEGENGLFKQFSTWLSHWSKIKTNIVPIRTNKKPCVKPIMILRMFKGLFLSALSSLFFTICAVIVKYLKYINPVELALIRFMGIFLFSYPIALRFAQKKQISLFGPTDLRKLLIIRGLIGCTSLLLRFYAYRLLPIVDASAIVFSVPIFVTIAACIFLKEPCSMLELFSVVFTMIGLCLSMKTPLYFLPEYFSMPSNYDETNKTNTFTNSTMTSFNLFDSKIMLQDHNFALGIFCALISIFFSTSVYVMLRKLKNVNYSIVMFNFGLVAIIESLLILLIFQKITVPKDSFSWFLILLLAIASFLGQVLLTKSLQVEMAAPVSMVRSATDITLAFLFEYYIFDQIPDIWSVSGATIITICILIVNYHKWRTASINKITSY